MFIYFCIWIAISKEMATHSSFLAWKIPWTEEPGRLQSIGSQKSRTRLSDFTWISSCVCECVLNYFSCVWLFATPWTVALWAPLSMEFSRQEYWSGLACPPPRDLPDSGIEPVSLTFPALAGGFFITSVTWEAHPVVPVLFFLNKLLSLWILLLKNQLITDVWVNFFESQF